MSIKQTYEAQQNTEKIRCYDARQNTKITDRERHENICRKFKITDAKEYPDYWRHTPDKNIEVAEQETPDAI